jgi:hypothetical protein
MDESWRNPHGSVTDCHEYINNQTHPLQNPLEAQKAAAKLETE